MDQFYMEEKSGVITLKCRAFDEIPWLRYGFSTRHGGVSQGEWASLSFSYQKESEAIVDENFRRFCAANGLPFESLALTHQTHTANVAVLGAEYKNKGRERSLRDTDGIVSAEQGLGLICFTADCVPILLVDPKAKVIGAVHAGWRGTVASIAREAVQKMVALGADPAEMMAAIGPSIGPCHFEVGPEVQAEFTARFGEALPFLPSQREGHSMIDLWQANRLVLLEAGLQNDRIFTANLCTYCNNSTFYSHRYTNGRRGSLIGAISMEVAE
jgi:YfiH family protein